MRTRCTHLGVYKLFSKEELESADPETIKRKTEEALNFDVYREQEQM